MSNLDFIIHSLNIANVSIDNVIKSCDTLTYFLSTNISTQTCPCCGHHTSYVHDYRTQKIKDLPIHRLKVSLVIKKRRYVCHHCGKKFYEFLPFIQKYKRVTDRLRQSVFIDLHEPYTMKNIASKHSVSTFFVQQVLDEMSIPIESPNNIIAIDEFKGNADGEKFQTIITDPVNKKVLNILPDRHKLHIDKYFNSIPNKQNIRYVVMDMWKPYYDLAKQHFKNATIIIDRYHFVRQVVWAVENVRKRVQRKLSKEDRKFFKHSKKLLLKSKANLTIDELDNLYVMFTYSEDLRLAYDLKHIFYDILKKRNKQEVKESLINYIEMLKDSKLKEFRECIRAFSNWLDPIANGIVETYNNAYTEGKNNKTKVLKRISYGIRTFKNLQKRILLINKNLHFQDI